MQENGQPRRGCSLRLAAAAPAGRARGLALDQGAAGRARLTQGRTPSRRNLSKRGARGLHAVAAALPPADRPARDHDRCDGESNRGGGQGAARRLARDRPRRDPPVAGGRPAGPDRRRGARQMRALRAERLARAAAAQRAPAARRPVQQPADPCPDRGRRDHRAARRMDGCGRHLRRGGAERHRRLLAGGTGRERAGGSPGDAVGRRVGAARRQAADAPRHRSGPRRHRPARARRPRARRPAAARGARPAGAGGGADGRIGRRRQGAPAGAPRGGSRRPRLDGVLRHAGHHRPRRRRDGGDRSVGRDRPHRRHAGRDRGAEDAAAPADRPLRAPADGRHPRRLRRRLRLRGAGAGLCRRGGLPRDGRHGRARPSRRACPPC